MEKAKFTIIDDRLDYRKQFGLIHTETNELIGSCYVVHDFKYYKIFCVEILESFQGKGYGTLMLKDIIKKYKSKRKPLWLWVSKDNRIAIHLYKKLGFKTAKNNVMFYSE